MNNQVKIGCNIFIIQDNKVLLGKRKNCYGEGDWGIPGGHLEYGEKLVDAAKRELKEELGIENAKLRLLNISDALKGKTNYLQINFLLENFDGKYQIMEPDKCEELRFFSKDALPENIFVGHIEAIETFKQNKLYLY